MPGDLFEAGERTSAGRELCPGGIEEAGAEGAEGAGAAVSGGAAADADEEGGGGFGGSGGDELADAEAIGAEGVALVGLEMKEAVGLGSFDDGCSAFTEAEVPAEDASAEGVVDDDRGGIGTDGAAEGVEEAGTAIGEGEEVDLPGGAYRMDAGGDRGGGFIGGEGTLELLGRDEDAHSS